MANENIELLRRGLDAFNRRDRAQFLDLLDPEVENVPPRDWPEFEPTRGAEAVWDYLVDGQVSWGAGTYEYGEIVEVADDKLVTAVTGAMQGRASGAGVDWSFWQVTTHRHGKLLRMEWFADRDEAMAAAGAA